ncbi:MAG: flippase-like domain-containing protein [Candidatus Latescibacteria bacterium]|nr:flippase-like domain-containing protein [Candidatus Latescibacterota bacterium]
MKRFFIVLLKLTISLTLIVIFFAKFDLDVGRLFDEWRSVDRFQLLLAVIVFSISNLIGAAQWHLLLRAQGIVLRFPHVVASYFTGLFFNNLLMGNIGGDVIRVYDIRRAAGDGSAGFAATFLDRLLGLVVLLSFVMIAYPITSDPIKARMGSSIVVVTAVMGIIMTLGFSRRVGRTVQSVTARWLPDRFTRTMNRVMTSLIRYRGKRRTMAVAALIAITVQILRIVSYFMVGLSLGMATPFRYFLVFIPLIAIVAAIPVSFGGLGVRENMTVLLFAGVGVPSTTAWSLGFLGYLVGIASSLPGVIAFNLRSLHHYETR